jgi:hypothetical protein
MDVQKWQTTQPNCNAQCNHFTFTEPSVPKETVDGIRKQDLKNKVGLLK